MGVFLSTIFAVFTYIEEEDEPLKITNIDCNDIIIRVCDEENEGSPSGWGFYTDIEVL